MEFHSAPLVRESQKGYPGNKPSPNTISSAPLFDASSIEDIIDVKTKPFKGENLYLDSDKKLVLNIWKDFKNLNKARIFRLEAS